MKKPVHNYIISRLDYCNRLYYKLPAYQLKNYNWFLIEQQYLLLEYLQERELPQSSLIFIGWQHGSASQGFIST